MTIDGSGRQDTLHSLGNAMCYETTEPLGPWYDMIDVCYILGPALLALNFENPASMIPEHRSRSCASCFPVGSAD